jgi:glucokinase
MTTLHLGLDLGGTNIKVATLSGTDDGFKVLTTDSVETGAADGPEAVVANLVEIGSKITGAQPVDTLGLGVPGHFDRDSGQILLFPNLPGDWEGFPLRAQVESGLGIPTWMINDARAFTLAEGILGAGKGCDTLACITLGTGVGGGIMIQGKLHRGAFGVAGEIGHQTIIPDGPPCGCGNRGCVEALARADVLADLAGKATAAEVFEAAKLGEPESTAAIAQVAGTLGIALSNVVTLIGPDRIVVGGGIAEAGDLVLGPIKEAVKSRVTLVPTEKIEIVPAHFGRFAGAVGAALAGAIRP